MIRTGIQEQLNVDCSGIRNKIKGFGQGFRNNKKIVQELGTKIKDQYRNLGTIKIVQELGTKLKDSDRDLGTIKRLFRNQEQK